MTPIGNFVVLSVDDEADPDRGSAIAAFTGEPRRARARGDLDLAGRRRGGSAPWTRASASPSPRWSTPRAAHDSSVRLYETEAGPDSGGMAGRISVQENVVSFVPRCELSPQTEYTLEISAGGVVDFSGNPTAATFTARFSTGG